MRRSFDKLRASWILAFFLLLLWVPSAQAEPQLSAVERIGRRTEKSKTWMLDNGSIRAEYHIAPIHYQKAGEWKEIETDLLPTVRPGYTLEVTKNLFSVYLTSQGGYRIEVEGHWVEFAPQGLNLPVQATVKDNTVTIVDAWKDTDLRIRIGPGQVKETILLKGASSPRSFSWAVTYDDSAILDYIKTPWANYEDALIPDVGLEVEMRWNPTKDILTYELTSEPEHYPVIIDPTFTIAANADDTLGQQQTGSPPGTNYVNADYCDFGKLRFASNNYEMDSYLRWSINIPDGSFITNAYIQVKAYTGGGTESFTAQIKLLDSDSQQEFSIANYANNTALLAIGTVGSVGWTTSQWTDNNTYNSSRISTLVQSFIDRSGYSSGNYIGIKIDRGDAGVPLPQYFRRFDQIDQSGGTPAKLIVEYTSEHPYSGMF